MMRRFRSVASVLIVIIVVSRIMITCISYIGRILLVRVIRVIAAGSVVVIVPGVKSWVVTTGVNTTIIIEAVSGGARVT
jgi:hypothetical protein